MLEKKKNTCNIHDFKGLVMLNQCISSALSTTIIICVMPLFVHSSCVEGMTTLFLTPVFTFSLNGHFMFCTPTLSDISIFFILFEFHKVHDIIAYMLTMLMLTLLKIYTAILMMNKILKVLYRPILLLELVTAPMIQIKEGGNPTLCPCIRPPSLVQTTNQWVTLPMSIYCIVVYSLCYILLSFPLGCACALYTNAIPFGACPLILALEGG